MDKELYANFRGAEIYEVLRVEVNEGDGTEDDPIRRVVYLLTKEGELLAKIGEVENRKFVGGERPEIDISPLGRRLLEK